MASHTPVIIVPGICGSSLWRLGGSFDAAINRIWLNTFALVVGRWRWLQLAPDGVSPVAGNPALSAQTILWDFYSPLVTQLVERGWDVDALPYDWRTSGGYAGEALTSKILKIYQGIPINLVCHSLGGLVARIACARLAASGDLAKVGRIVSLGTPHWGSWEAGGGLSCRDWPTSALAGLLAGLGVLNPLGLDFTLLQNVACSWPSMYQLLPSPLAPGMTLETALALYDEETWQQKGVPVDAGWMANAFNGWQSLPALPSGVPWLSVGGDGVETANGPDPSGICPTPSLCPHTNAGDGTVPLAYARYGTEPFTTLPLSHDLLAQDGRAVEVVDTWLRGGTPAGPASMPHAARAHAPYSSEEIQSTIRAREKATPIH